MQGRAREVLLQPTPSPAQLGAPAEAGLSLPLFRDGCKKGMSPAPHSGAMPWPPRPSHLSCLPMNSPSRSIQRVRAPMPTSAECREQTGQPLSPTSTSAGAGMARTWALHWPSPPLHVPPCCTQAALLHTAHGWESPVSSPRIPTLTLLCTGCCTLWRGRRCALDHQQAP